MKTCISCGEPPDSEHAYDIYDGSGPFCSECRKASELITHNDLVALGIIKPLPQKGSFSDCTNNTTP